MSGVKIVLTGLFTLFILVQAQHYINTSLQEGLAIVQGFSRMESYLNTDPLI